MSIEMSIQQYMAYIDAQLLPVGEARVDANTASRHYFLGHTPLQAVGAIRAHRENQKRHEYAAQVIRRLAEELVVMRDDLVTSACAIPEHGQPYDLATAAGEEAEVIASIDDALSMAKPWLDWDPLEMPVRRLEEPSDKGVGLDVQEASAEQFCRAKGWTTIEEGGWDGNLICHRTHLDNRQGPEFGSWIVAQNYIKAHETAPA